MLMTAKPAPDGALKPARNKLNAAISNLIERWEQLLDAVPEQNNSRRATAKSKPPMWIDGMSLVEEIRAGVDKIEPGSGSVTGKLYQIRRRGWRPQDVADMDIISGKCERWVSRIDDLLDPHRWHLTTPCPACGATFVYCKDSSTGQLVRQPALQIGKNGCQCQNCKTLWGPQLYQHLARVLGCPTPEGVLE